MTADRQGNTYSFLLDTYETEILKIVGIWKVFPESASEFRPAPKARSVIEQFEHQVQSEGRWMREMLGIDTGDPNPPTRTASAFLEKYRSDANERLRRLREKPDEWWREDATFFDTIRSRAWILTRRIAHSAHHRGQLIVYLRLLGLTVPSVYGPTADTNGRVVYSFS
jgi:uncharacterized damage-inducible protein DinB